MQYLASRRLKLEFMPFIGDINLIDVWFGFAKIDEENQGRRYLDAL